MQPTPPKPPQPAPESAPAVALKTESSPVATTAESGKTLDTSPQNYYQAIGWLRGKLVKDEEERFGVQIRDITFPLYLPRRVMAVANRLLEQMVWMKCYPQSKGEGIGFKVVWIGNEQTEKGEPGIFVLRGVWQFIPQCRRPVFSIYRNELKNYENRPTNQHLPLIWADQAPYRFRKDSEERPKFYQILARLIPQRGCFGFVSQIADPIEQTPRRVKKPPLALPEAPSKSSKPKPTAKADSSEAPADPDLFPAQDVAALEQAPTETVIASEATSPVLPTVAPDPEADNLETPEVLAGLPATESSSSTLVDAETIARKVAGPETSPILPQETAIVPAALTLETQLEPEESLTTEPAPAPKAKRESKGTTKAATKTKTSRKKSTS